MYFAAFILIILGNDNLLGGVGLELGKDIIKFPSMQ